MQSEKLKRLIFGMGAITALALLLIGVMLGRAGLKEGQTGEELTRPAGQLDLELHGDDVKERLGRLNKSIKSAPIGARFLNKLLSSRINRRRWWLMALFTPPPPSSLATSGIAFVVKTS